MKSIYNKFLFVCVFIVICAQMAYADSEGSTFIYGSNIYRVISVDEYECELFDVIHNSHYFEIPEKVNWYTVVSIADKAFKNLNSSNYHSSKNIKTPNLLEFPPTIRNVGKYIFDQGYGYETSELNTIIIHEGTNVSSNAFSNLVANLRCVYLLGETGLGQFNTKIDKEHEDCVLILPNDGRDFTAYSHGVGCFTKVAPYGFSAYYSKSKGLYDYEKRYDGPIIVPVGEYIDLIAQSYPASYGKGMTVSVENTEILQENYAVRYETFNENSNYNCGKHSTPSYTCTNCMANGGAIGNFSYRAVKPGNTSISFSTTNGTTKTFDVIVVEAKVKSIELSTDLDCVFPGETVHLSAKVSPENAIQTVKYEVNNGSQLGWTDLCDDKIEVSPEWDGNVSTIRIRAKSTDGFDVTSGICDVRICNVNKMHFYTDSLTVGVGDTKSNSLYFGNISPYTVLHYKSEDENIAIAGDEAKITGVSPGRTTISVYRKGCNIPIANFPVEVYVPVKSIELDRYEIHVPFYTYFTINAKVLPENATDKRISFYKTSAINGHDNKWYISPPFNNGAEIEAHSVENPDIKAVCKVYQETFQYGLSNLDSDKIYLSRGESVTVEPFIRPEYQNDRTWEYSSSDSDIAEINQNGCITAKNIGTTTICVSTDTDGWRAVIYKDVIVINKVSSISLNPSSAEEKEGEQIQIKATVLPEDATNKVLAWSSSDESVASVDNNGLVSLLKEGHALITAYSTDGSDIVATCNISVIKRDVLVSSISLDSSYAEGKEGEQIQIKATVLPEDATNKVLAWSSSDESVASVDDNGLVSLLKEGHALITAYATDGSDIIATCNISVIKRDVLVAYISFDPSYAEGKEGEQIQIKATVLPEDATNKVLAWSSSDESVASVDNNGLVSLLKEGHALITAYATDGSDIVATCNISVMKRDVLVSSISLDPSYAEGKEGEQIQIKATVLPEDATNKTIEWSSSDESTATVDDFGLISLLKKGTAVIMASTTDGSGISAECAVVVSELLGIEEILTNESSYVKIFNLSGILVYEGIYSDANLVPDYYIVVCDGKNVKAKILHKNATSMTNRQ